MAGAACRLPNVRLAVKFRVNKKMLLADVLLAAPVPLTKLLEQSITFQDAAGANATDPHAPQTDRHTWAEGIQLPWET